MRMILKSLHMENFKGIKNLDVNFSNKTSIKGQNAVGKTTIFDAFTWLLFNKNSAGEEKFNVRPLDKYGKRIDNVEIKVVGVIFQYIPCYCLSHIPKLRQKIKTISIHPMLLFIAVT